MGAWAGIFTPTSITRELEKRGARRLRTTSNGVWLFKLDNGGVIQISPTRNIDVGGLGAINRQLAAANMSTITNPRRNQKKKQKQTGTLTRKLSSKYVRLCDVLFERFNK